MKRRTFLTALLSLAATPVLIKARELVKVNKDSNTQRITFSNFDTFSECEWEHDSNNPHDSSKQQIGIW